MSIRPLAILYTGLFLVLYHSLVNSQIYRSSCRRDALMKATDRGKKLVGTASDIVSKLQSKDVRFCVKACSNETQCKTINFKNAFLSVQEDNCELLKITKDSTGPTLNQASDWIHYEPATQASARCRGVNCKSGYKCIETCEKTKGWKCVAVRKYTSCLEARLAAGPRIDGVYSLWDSTKSTEYSAYCHMSHGGWTLIARFSNADSKNWMAMSGNYWYDQTAVGSTTSPSANTDMISKAFYNVKGTDIKLTKSDSPSHGYLLYSTSCLSTSTFREKITSYGNFRNNAMWGKNKCMGSCSVNAYGSVTGVSGFSQYACSGTVQSAKYIGFWCHYGTGDAAVIMIGGGGNACGRADHGIGITEGNYPRFGSMGTSDFGDDSNGSKTYSLNLWIR